MATLRDEVFSGQLSRVSKVCQKEQFAENQSLLAQVLRRERETTYLPVWRRVGEVIVVVDNLGVERGGGDAAGVVGDHP